LAISAALVGSSQRALASPGCTAFNGSFDGVTFTGSDIGTGFDAATQ
jgi:hypothetical protein